MEFRYDMLVYAGSLLSRNPLSGASQFYATAWESIKSIQKRNSDSRTSETKEHFNEAKNTRGVFAFSYRRMVFDFLENLT